MAGQELFQIVSTGKTLRGKPAEEVIDAAARLFKVPSPQAQRLLLKGWVIKDRLSRSSVVEYQTRLHKIGLKIAVCPAGKFDNRALVARLNAASQRRARRKGEGKTATTPSGPAGSAGGANPAEKPSASAPATGRSERERQALESLNALFAGSGGPRQSVSDWLGVMPGVLGAAVVPGLFLLLALFLLVSAVEALWAASTSVIGIGSAGAGVTGALTSLLLIAVVSVFTVVPYFRVKPAASDSPAPDSRPLKRDEAPQLFLMLEALSTRTGLPAVVRVEASRDASVLASANLGEVWRQQVSLSVGLSAVKACNGAEFLALVSRALGPFAGRTWGLVSWLVFGSAHRLLGLQRAFEEGRVLAVQGEPGPAVAQLDRLLGYAGRPLASLVDRLLALHQRLGGGGARLLQRRADRWMAAIIGSDAFAGFAEKWQQLDHSALIAAEANSEAAVANQRLADFPAAVVWLMEHLDAETRGNLELAMTHASDPWDASAPADIDRIGEAEAEGVDALLCGSFAPQKLFQDFPALSTEVSDGEDLGAEPVDHLQILAASQEAEEAKKVLQEYFNRVTPPRLLPLELPQSDELAAMDLQATIDWLRGKLVELREFQSRLAELENRGALMQLGRTLVKAQLTVNAPDYLLSGVTVTAAEESMRDNRARRGDLESQIRAIHSVFALRLERAREQLPAAEAGDVSAKLELLREFESLGQRLEAIDSHVKVLNFALERVIDKREARPAIERLVELARGELQGLQSALAQCPRLSRGDWYERLSKRFGQVANGALPDDRQGREEVLRQLQAQLKAVSAEVVEEYRVVLAKVLAPCLQIERSNKVRPLRLVAVPA
ncbi:hypothetical protein AWR36_002840 [Microbulbifer flavimaris]|uniref:Uncharacterized protein n=1 Tax=Microbulbifer flavimaris TaxID=1781068 RepID=A0ABX4I3S1_9GAMM|nr:MULTISPECIES: hypothetical protein [Microbulbifer]KUJ84610.1 hypothetical protein AVO43_02845 [Microbulbifer sp. ZGT114]PCO06698.1 hypothetical protein AWR36_002840 [Microbulbifer flavimaris]